MTFLTMTFDTHCISVFLCFFNISFLLFVSIFFSVRVPAFGSVVFPPSGYVQGAVTDEMNAPTADLNVEWVFGYGGTMQKKSMHKSLGKWRCRRGRRQQQRRRQ